MPPNLAIRGLWKRYGPVEALRGVDLEAAPGEILGLLGRNGSGKSTLIECAIGLRQPDRGQIELCGIDVGRQGAAARERIGAALQTTAWQPAITPREALRLHGSFYRRRIDPRLLLDQFGLAARADVRCETLSGGERQRLALALAFANHPQLIFLDEPTAGLDPPSQHELHALIRQLKRDGCTVFLTTHQLTEAADLCDRIAVIDRGRIIHAGTPAALGSLEEIFRSPGGPTSPGP
jgi:ABC-2 type transport system ATP-binding protein